MTDATTLSELDPTVRDRLSELPATASIVYLELANAGGPRTLQRLTHLTGRPQTSVHRALRQLHDEDLVSCSPRHRNPPTSEWQVNE